MHFLALNLANYCPVVWMFHSQTSNNKINRLHERCLRVIYKDKNSNFENLLEKDNSVSIYYRKVQTLAIEMYKVASGTSPEITNEIFQPWGPYLRYTSEFIIPPIHSVYNGKESVPYLGLKIWEVIPPLIWQIDFLSVFKKSIKNGSLVTAHFL